MVRKKIKAIVFDMDGVLIDAKDWHYSALNKALALFGLEISRHDHLVTFDGLSTSQKLMMLSKTEGLPVSLHEFVNELKQQYTMELIYQLCKPVFHHQYALAKLSEMGYKLAVASNSVRNTVEVMMEKASLARYLEFVLSNQDVKNAKPAPDIYKLAVSRLNIAARECVVIEDNDNGVQAAKAAGVNVLQVDSVHDVTLENIKNFIAEVENA